MANLFVYGSLMNEMIMARVVGRLPESAEATARNYRRCRLQDRSYPGLYALEGASCDGVLYFDVQAGELSRLDRFEGSEYDRMSLKVDTEGSATEAFAYVITKDIRKLCLDEDWDYGHFMQFEYEQFCKLFM